MQTTDQFERRVAEFVREHEMVPAGTRLGLAVSGGADSVCLLHALTRLREELGISLAVLHLNHALRGAESDEDEAFVRELAATLGLPFFARRLDAATVPATGIEEWARSQRQQFFADQIATGTVARVATGHTQRDQAETILFRLLRGAGSHGLGGIAPVSEAGLVRPLLWATRTAVEQYLAQRGCSWREDSSNFENRHARNALRNEWMPRLRDTWNPALDKVLAATGEILREESRYLDRIAEEKLLTIASETRTGWEIDAALLAAEPVAIQRRILRTLAARTGTSSWDLADIERARALLAPPAGSGLFSAGGTRVERSMGHLRVCREQDGKSAGDGFHRSAPAVDNSLAWPIRSPGDFHAGELGTLELIEIAGSNPSHTNRLQAAKSGYTEGWSFLRPTILRPGLVLRPWHAGDAYQPSGSRSTRKLKELFQRHRIPRWRRAGTMVLDLDGEIVWCSRFGSAGQFVPGPSEQSFLAVRWSEF